jgi:ankyrin repeat protein
MMLSHLLVTTLATTLFACAHTASPTPRDCTPVFDAIKRGDAAAVSQQLAHSPACASATSPSGSSAVLLAMFRLQDNQEDFYPPASNTVLRAVLAAHPTLDGFETAALGDPAAVARSIADPDYVTRVHSIGWTALHFAAFAGNAAAVALLLDRGAALEQRAHNSFANTPLHVALLTGDLATVQLLVARGANLTARYDHGTTPLQQAAALGRVDLLTLLLDHGAPINDRSDAGSTALFFAVRGHHDAAAALLRQRGAEG